MNEIIKITTNENGAQTVSARDLHLFLGAKTQFTDWAKSQFDKAMLIEDYDFVTITEKKVTAQGNESEYTDYALTLSSSKEIAMLNGGKKGKEARLYFIECEKVAFEKQKHSIPQTYLEALEHLIVNEKEKLLLSQQNEKQQAIIEYHQPKVEAHDMLMEAGNVIDLEATAKTLGWGRNKLINKMKELKILASSGLPYQDLMESGYFRVKQRLLPNRHMHPQVFVTAKGLGFLSKKISL